MLASINMVEKPHMLQSIWDASDTTSGEGASGALGVAPRHEGFPGSSDGEESACNAGNLGLIPGLGRSHGEGHGYTHSSILTWRIPWTEEPGGLQSMGSQRVGHD